MFLDFSRFHISLSHFQFINTYILRIQSTFPFMEKVLLNMDRSTSFSSYVACAYFSLVAVVILSYMDLGPSQRR